VRDSFRCYSQELYENGQLPLELVRGQRSVDTVVDPETSQCSDLDEDIEETNETTSNRRRSVFGEVDGDDERQETDGETTQESSDHEDFDGTVGESLRKGGGDEDDVGEDDGPLSAVLFSQGQLHTGTEEGTALEKGDQVGLCGRASFAHLEVALE
jgi:hypothetical protein